MTFTGVEFESEGRTLRGWLSVPDGAGPHPGIVLTGGFAGVKEGFLGHPFHEVFADAGFTVLLHDHPNCGESDGEPRQELDPVLQQRGYRDAISFLIAGGHADPERIGIWGTSYSGGHVLAVAAADRRVRCVVSQVMTISGRANLLRRHQKPDLEAMWAAWAADRVRRARGEPAALVAAFPPDSETLRFNLGRPEAHRERWRNEVTVRTWEHYASYEPAAFIERIAPIPLLMIVAADDLITPAEDSLAAYARAGQPKELLVVEGGHYGPVTVAFAEASAAARDWFVRHLGPAPSRTGPEGVERTRGAHSAP